MASKTITVTSKQRPFRVAVMPILRSFTWDDHHGPVGYSGPDGPADIYTLIH
jgi:hypothetical protein